MVKATPLYQQIVESIRTDLLTGRLKPGDLLPPVREMAERWRCTPGTVQQAYGELAQQGLVIGHAGQRTRIGASVTPSSERSATTLLRRAALVNQAEAFLLGVVAAGYSVGEVETAFRTALDRWRALAERSTELHERDLAVLRFAGSHDPAVSLLSSLFGQIYPGCTLDISFSGSLGGLIALAEDKADIAGSHLWDAESDTYNAPFVRRLLPGRRVALLTLAHRRLGLIVRQGNPFGLTSIVELGRPGLRIVHRQRGAGTRVWLEAQLHQHGLDASSVISNGPEAPTHDEVARMVADARADAGLGVETAALAYGLGFVPLAVEPYDLIIPADRWGLPPVQALAGWLQGSEAHSAIAALGGYDTHSSGETHWIE